MHLHWERSSNSAGDCSIRDLSWMGRVPEEIPEEDGWKLSRNNYYQEGWLATANVRGVVGVTYTTSFCGGGQPAIDVPARTNYNLRGHRSEVTMVKWNEPYQKLASCDSTGIIFVWIKYEGRWSIELINDRNTPVTSFSWSHDGRMALICYQDGFVLVGSVAGQRYWSTMLPADSTIATGAWTPDDQQVYIATAEGGLIVMDVHGNIVSKVTLTMDSPITELVWNCEKFNMEERDDTSNPFVDNKFNASRLCCLAVCFKNGDVKLLTSYDDVSPQLLHTGFYSMKAEWSNSGELLAVAGRVIEPSTTPLPQYVNRVKFFNHQGAPVSTVTIPGHRGPVTALTWGHNDKRIFIATGSQVHIGWVSRKIASLQLLCRLKIHQTLRSQEQVEVLPLPCRLKSLLSSLFTQSIKCEIPERKALRRFVSRPPAAGLRLYCTMIRHGEEATGSNYTIYLEHLGGFLPILKGRKTSKIKPEFVIFDPLRDPSTPLSSSSCPTGSDTDTDTELGTKSPRLRRRRRRRRNQPHYFGYLGNEEVDYLNTLPEEGRLVEITSNIWGTKFKIHGLDASLPPLLGQISYKASLLHLQPRQMRLIVTELRDDMLLQGGGYAASASEDEEETDRLTMEEDLLTAVTDKELPGAIVAPLPSLSNRLSVADFQRLPAQEEGWQSSVLPQVEVSVALSPVHNPAHILGSPAIPNPGIPTIPTIPTIPNHGIPTIPSPPKTHPPSHPTHTVAPSCSDSLLVEVQTEYPASLASIHKMKLGVSTNSSLPCQSTSSSLQVADWSLRRNLSGSKSFDISLESSPSSTSSGVRHRRGGMRRDSVGLSTSSTTSSSPASATSPGRWAAKADELSSELEQVEASVYPSSATQSSRAIRTSCSADHLGAIVDILGVPSSAPQLWDSPRRLILSAEKKKAETKRTLANAGKSRSLDTETPPSCPGESCPGCPGSHCAKDLSMNREMFTVSSPPEEDSDSALLIPSRETETPRTRRRFDSVRNLLERARAKLTRGGGESGSFGRLNNCAGGQGERLESAPGSPVHVPRSKWRERLAVPDQQVTQSSPNTPLMARKLKSKSRNQSFSPIRTLLNSPLLRRKRGGGGENAGNKSSLDSSEEELNLCASNSPSPTPRHRLLQERLTRPRPDGYQNLETFQKQKLKQKLRKLGTQDSSCSSPRPAGSPAASPRLPRARVHPELVMHNKAPLWNEGSQVYQLDFGGRVTQESAKNFQIEYLGKQVMQFGRIDANAYTLDFQYPLTAIQAFSVALANVTQRLK